MKNLFNKPLISLTAAVLNRCCIKHGVTFDSSGFINEAVHDLDALELKARSKQITDALCRYLPSSFERAVAILNDALLPVEANADLKEVTTTEQGLAGWILMPVSDYVGINGQQHISLAMESLKLITQRFSSEFGIRHLLLTQPHACLEIMQTWLYHDCHHVRRLVSEGTRPLLPWAMQLPEFKSNPQWAMPLLEALKDDSSEYVRRSVANHINDISKTHPDLVAEVSGRWLASVPQSKSQAKHRIRLVNHACRTLIKAGNKQVLAHLGFQPTPPVEVTLSLEDDMVIMGGYLEIVCTVHNQSDQPQPIIIDYRVRHKKANGLHTPKVFKWKTLELGPNERITINKRHPFKLITTRVYYEGEQGLDIQVNGEIKASTDFFLKLNA